MTETGIPCVIYGELFTTYGETISQIESHTYKTEGIILSKKGDLLFPSSTTVDAMSLIAPSVINMDGVILGGDMFGIHISPNFNAQYLSYYFNHIAKGSWQNLLRVAPLFICITQILKKPNYCCLLWKNKIEWLNVWLH